MTSSTTASSGSRWTPALILLLIALAIRAWDFGNPVIAVDEQYYLLVGDRMLHGAIPFVDIWDRKPIGLFLLFAAIRLLPGDGILAYQLVATGCAWLTAVLVHHGAMRIGATRRGALAAGATYLAGLSLLSGGGGQAPVFYNLPIAIAALLTFRLPALAAANDRRAIVRGGALACLLAGIAIQMKYTPAFEGAFFGLAHLWFHRRTGAPVSATLGAALLWIAVGLAPSLAALGWYTAHDLFATFWFANVTSIFLRPGYPLEQVVMRLLGILVQLLPLIAAAAITWHRRAHLGIDRAVARLAFGWLVAASLGFLAIGTFFDHYGLPLIASLAIAAAPALSRHAKLLAIALIVPFTILAVERVVRRDDAPGAYALARIVRANSGDECPYVFRGDTVTYLLARTCVPTPYAFPNLLSLSTEQGATGIDEAAEVRRILANRPPVIVTSTRRLSIWNVGSLRALKATLASDYRLVFTTRRLKDRSAVYLRNDRVFVTPGQRAPSSPVPTAADGR